MPIEGEIHNKELAHITMEAEKAQDLQLANWRPRRAVVSSKSEAGEPTIIDDVSFSPSPKG
jgi:hypothetical protein